MEAEREMMEVEVGRKDVEAPCLPRKASCDATLSEVEPKIHLTASELSYTLVKSKKMLLEAVSADFGPGELTAVMGPSGAGKTTFLNSLSARVPQRTARITRESIRANGVPVSSTRVFSAFGTVAPQDDVVLPALTVQESLDFAAKLRGSTEGRVEALMRTFELDGRRDLAAGALSGGQRKRLSICLELVHSPSVCLVDEPTSGLDSRVAYQVVQTLAALCAQTKMTIVATIHQPSTETFFTFDRLLVLTAGKVAYRGPVSKAVSYFSSSSPPQKTEDDAATNGFPRNPADEAIDQASDSAAAIRRWAAYRDDDADFRAAETERENALSSKTTDLNLADARAANRPSAKKAFAVLVHRTALQAMRLQGLHQIRSAIATSLLYGLIFLQQQNTQARASNKLSAYFLTLLMNGLIPGIVCALFVPNERPTLRREFFNGVWTLKEYLAARSLVNAVIHFCGCTAYVVIVYHMVGMRGHFGRLLVPLLFLGFITQQLGLLLGSVFTSSTVSVPAFIPINILAVIFAGFFFKSDFLTKGAQKPLFFLWYLSFYRYVFALIVTNEFLDGNFDSCDPASDFCPYTSFADFPGQRHVPRKVVPRDLLEIDTGFALRWTVLILLTFLLAMYALTYFFIRRITLVP